MFFLQQIFLIASGAALGGVARWGISGVLNRSAFGAASAQAGIIAGTLAANLLGCLIIGALSVLCARFDAGNLRLFAITGFCGALTTFSTFSHESLQLLSASPWAFAANIAANLAGCLAMTFIGYLLFR